jgi:hypothetical protein
MDVFSTELEIRLSFVKTWEFFFLVGEFEHHNLPLGAPLCAPVFTGNTFQDLPLLRKTTDNTERYI